MGVWGYIICITYFYLLVILLGKLGKGKLGNINIQNTLQKDIYIHNAGAKRDVITRNILAQNDSTGAALEEWSAFVCVYIEFFH